MVFVLKTKIILSILDFKLRMKKQTPTSSKDDHGLWKALHEFVQLAMEITKENDPRYYAWMMKRNDALRKEREAREERLKIENERPKRKWKKKNS